MGNRDQQRDFRKAPVRRWLIRLWREWTVESRRPIAPAFTKPQPTEWNDTRVTLAWLGHATVLINFFGIKILTDPTLFPRVGIRLPGLTIGPKRLTAPALTVRELPKVDVILLSHAHFDHFDLRTLHRISRCTGFQPVKRHSGSDHRLATGRVRPIGGQDADATVVITAPRTSDLLRWTRLRDVTELRWGERASIETSAGHADIVAFRVKHWGARVQRDTYRGYNGYMIERGGRRIIFGGDTAMTESFSELRKNGRVDLAIMSIGCYNPWIRTHCNPEQAVQMANDAGAEFIMPVHHQTFRLSFEPFREPIERFEAALYKTPERIALREIGETFVLPM
jgi:L-ascorbate metabolism protein UlaG (beta-lactamase superfamily)